MSGFEPATREIVDPAADVQAWAIVSAAISLKRIADALEQPKVTLDGKRPNLFVDEGEWTPEALRTMVFQGTETPVFPEDHLGKLGGGAADPLPLPEVGTVTRCFRCGGARCRHCGGQGGLRWLAYGHSEPAPWPPSE